MDLELRQPSSDRDLDQTWEILRRSFNATPDERSDWDSRMRADRFWGLYDGELLMATAQIWSWSQSWGGRLVPCAGVASVGVDPAQRGRGLARRLLSSLLASGGWTTSALMPATTALYRSVGYEAAASWGFRRLSTRSLLSLPRPASARARRATVADVAALADLQRAASVGHDGWVALSDAWWDRTAGDFDSSFWYVVDGRGYVRYTQEDGDHGYLPTVQELVALDHDAALALWHVVGSSASMAPECSVNAALFPSLVLLLPEQDVRPHERELQLLLRLVDLPAAVAARGYPDGLSVSVDLEVTDDVVASNAGRWRLSVSGGEGRLERGGDGAVPLSIGALASLYAGWTSTATLTQTGHLPTPVPALDVAFATAGPPLLPTYF